MPPDVPSRSEILRSRWNPVRWSDCSVKPAPENPPRSVLSSDRSSQAAGRSSSTAATRSANLPRCVARSRSASNPIVSSRGARRGRMSSSTSKSSAGRRANAAPARKNGSNASSSVRSTTKPRKVSSPDVRRHAATRVARSRASDRSQSRPARRKLQSARPGVPITTCVKFKLMNRFHKMDYANYVKLCYCCSKSCAYRRVKKASARHPGPQRCATGLARVR